MAINSLPHRTYTNKQVVIGLGKGQVKDGMTTLEITLQEQKFTMCECCYASKGNGFQTTSTPNVSLLVRWASQVSSHVKEW